jgi:hypothetical protein
VPETDILKGQIIIGFIKKHRLNCLGHVEHMTEDNNVKKINPLNAELYPISHLLALLAHLILHVSRIRVKRWKNMSKRPIGRPKLRWEDDILEDIKSINVCNWKNVAQNRDRWKKVVEQARTLNML